MTKVCTKCNEEKDLDLFSKHPKGKLGKHPRCNDCRNKAWKAYYGVNSNAILYNQKRKAKYNPDYERKKKYGLSREDYLKMLSEQDNKCKICGVQGKLVVDHCHKTQIVRGLLCHKCNRGLGCFLDNQKSLESAIKYLGSVA